MDSDNEAVELSKDLSPEQTDTLINFQNLCGLDDLNHCRRILERSGWDPNIAVQHVFGEPDSPPRRDRGMGEGSSRNDIDAAPLIHNAYAPLDRNSPAGSASGPISYTGRSAPVERWGVYEWIKAAIAFPFRFIFSSLFEVFNFFWSFVAGPRFPGSSPVQDVEAFIGEFEQHYGTIHPNFYRGGYKEAYGDAKKELRFLLLYLHQDNHNDSERFCMDTLTNPDVVTLINSKALFWGCSTKYSEGYKVAQALQASRYPSVGLIACKNNQMTLVGRLQGYHTPQEFTERLNQLFNTNDRHLSDARLERRQLDMNQSLRREQDEAYQKSLKADQDKERAKREDKAKKELEERQKKEAVERKEREERQRGENLAQRKQRAGAHIPVEPSEGAADSCRISIKLPVGKRLERRFLNSNTVGDLYNYVFSQSESPEHFEVYTSYPRKSIDCVQGSPKTFASLGLGSAIVFIVEEKDVDTDNETDHRMPATV